MPLGQFRQHAEGEAVDHRQRAIGQRLGDTAGLCHRSRIGRRIAFAEGQYLDLPLLRAKAIDDAAVIGVAAGAGVQVARHQEAATPDGQSAAS